MHANVTKRAPKNLKVSVTNDDRKSQRSSHKSRRALRSQPGCATALVPAFHGIANVRGGRNWEIPNVVLGDSLISDVDRAVISVHRQLGRKFHLLAVMLIPPARPRRAGAIAIMRSANTATSGIRNSA